MSVFFLRMIELYLLLIKNGLEINSWIKLLLSETSSLMSKLQKKKTQLNSPLQFTWGRLYKTLNYHLTTQIVVKFNYLVKNKGIQLTLTVVKVNYLFIQLGPGELLFILRLCSVHPCKCSLCSDEVMKTWLSRSKVYIYNK